MPWITGIYSKNNVILDIYIFNIHYFNVYV